jgi:uncharacterized repeat protein (TIGR01451 family)
LTGNNGGYDYWVVKLDVTGNITWQKSLGGSGSDKAQSIQQTVDGGYIVAGYSNSNDGDLTGNNGSYDYWVVKLDVTGNISWQKSLGGSGTDKAQSIQQTTDGGYIVAGFSNSNDGDVTGNNGSYDYWVVKIDASGNITWQKSLGGTWYDKAYSIQQTTDGGYIVAGESACNDGDVTVNNGWYDYWLVKLDASGNIIWQKSLGDTDAQYARSIQQTIDGGFIIARYDSLSQAPWNRDFWIVKLDMSNIQGRIYNDLNENCILETSESGIAGIPVTISPGGFIAEVNSNGLWHLDSLPVGTYTATVDTTNLNWTPTCPVSQSFNVTDPQVYTPGPDFGMVNNNPCSSPEISIYAPFLRPCFSNQKVYVQACNEITATGILNSSYAEVELDPHFTPTSSSLPYTSLGSNLYRFQLGDLYPGQCVDFTINTDISCDAILDQTLCMDARLYPVDSCALDTIPTNPLPPTYGNDPNLVMPQPCTLPWDKSSLQVDGWCQGDSVQFSITNTSDLGDGDMDCYSPVLLYVNDTLVAIDSVQLQGQEIVYYSYPANGETWILAAEQHLLHPGNSHPNAHVELCGTDSSEWISNLINNYPLDDADPFVDIYCGVVTGSYDPNDKRGFPKGLGDQHFIKPNQQLQYVVRFQNTGTDTAFTVVIRDTLDTDLNIFTVTPGVSSHNYTFRMYGPRVLEWTFDNILLPDSTTNEPESNGFITFTVDQVPNLPNGTIINNQADIYFDFNDPIITNETDHIVNDMIGSSPLENFVHIEVTECSSYTWNTNGQTYTSSGQYSEVLTNQSGLDSLVTLNLTINHPTNSSEIITTCNASYTWNADGQTYNQSGSYTALLTNADGCDSTVTLDLTIDTVNNLITQTGDITLEADASSAQYQWVNCDQNYQVVPGETNQSFEATNNGNYAAIVTENGCTDTTDCIIIDKVGLQEITKQTLKIYPNPTSNSFTISSAILINSAFKIIDAPGKEVLTGNMNGKEQIIDISNLSNGVYSVVFDNSELPVLSVIKE